MKQTKFNAVLTRDIYSAFLNKTFKVGEKVSIRLDKQSNLYLIASKFVSVQIYLTDIKSEK